MLKNVNGLAGAPRKAFRTPAGYRDRFQGRHTSDLLVARPKQIHICHVIIFRGIFGGRRVYLTWGWSDRAGDYNFRCRANRRPGQKCNKKCKFPSSFVKRSMLRVFVSHLCISFARKTRNSRRQRQNFHARLYPV